MNLNEDLILIGGGGHCRSCVDVIEMDGRFAIRGIVDEKDCLDHTLTTYPLLGREEDLFELAKSCQNFLVTIGQIKSPEPRIRLFGHHAPHHRFSSGPCFAPGRAWGGDYYHAPRSRQRWCLCRTQLHHQYEGSDRARRRCRRPLPHFYCGRCERRSQGSAILVHRQQCGIARIRCGW